MDGNKFGKWVISKSKIEGIGVFSAFDIKKDSFIGTVIVYVLYFFPVITRDFGSMINHSHNPNSKLEYNEDKRTWELLAIKDIFLGTEITVDYDDTPWFIEKSKPWYK